MDMIEINGVQRPRQNNRGLTIHPTDAGIRNFWAWFGDSETIDEQGRPVVFYRGQDSYYNDGSLLDRYFTNCPKYASSYDDGDTSFNVIPVYIKSDCLLVASDINDVTDWEYDRSSLLAEGYDAISAKDFDVIVALSDDSQIKSAVGNSGKFSDNTNAICDHQSAKHSVNRRIRTILSNAQFSALAQRAQYPNIQPKQYQNKDFEHEFGVELEAS